MYGQKQKQNYWYFVVFFVRTEEAKTASREYVFFVNLLLRDKKERKSEESE